MIELLSRVLPGDSRLPPLHAVHPLRAGDAHLRGEGQASLIFSPLLYDLAVLFYPYEQCWGSGSRTGSGSAYFGPP